MHPSFRPINSTAIPRLAALVGSEPLDRWKDCQAFHTLNQQANVLPKPIRDASFAFKGTALQCTPQQRARDIQAFNSSYVERFFPASAKARSSKW